MICAHGVLGKVDMCTFEWVELGYFLIVKSS